MSTTKNLGLFKHDNPATNTEKFDIGNYLNGNWDKIDENVGEVNTNISNINSKNKEQDTNIEQLQESTETSSNKIAKLEKELKEAQEDFYQNSIRGQASGEYIHVEDSSNCRAKIGINGNSEQETRSGKNKLNSASIGVGTNNGITCTYDSKTGIITFNGACNTDNTRFTFENTSIPFTNNLTKTLAYYVSGSITTYCLFRTFDSEWSAGETLNLLDLSSSKNKTRIISSNTTIKTNIDIRFNNGSVANNFQIKLMITDSENDDYEQYGAMPSPDYQSPKKTVGSNVNIFDLESYYNVVPSANCLKQLLKNGIRLNFTAGNDAFIGDVYNTGTTMTENKRPACIKVKPNTTYTLKMSSAPKCYMSFFDKNYKSVKDYVQITSSNYIFTTNSSTCYIYLRLGYQNRTSGLTFYDFTDIKCVEGTEVGEYSKFGQGCVKVTKCNKNLFDKSKALTGYWITDEQGNIGQAGATAFVTDFIPVFKDVPVYIPATGTSRREFYNKNKVGIQYLNNSNVQIFTPTEDGFIRVSCNMATITMDNLMIFYGETSTSYEQHEEQSYIIPVQQEMLEGDYFDWDNEEEVHIFGKKVLTGNENWEAIGTNTSGKYRFQTKVDDIAFNADGDTYLEGICDSYKVGTPNTTYLCQESIATVQNYLIIYNEKVNDTVENFEKGLSNKNVTIYYKIATPERLKFTDEQKAVAKELNNARTYKNVTNITTDSKAILSLDYAKDLETLLNNTQALAVNNASEGV